MITIGIAEDHQLVRQGIVALLKREADFQVVGEAEDGFEALRLVGNKHPEILLLDLSIPGVHGLEVTRQVCATNGKANGATNGTANGTANGPTRVIIVTLHRDESFVVEALRHGAAGYVLKDSSCGDLIEAIRKVKVGRKYLSPSLADLAISVLAHKAPDPAADGFDLLSDRERLVLQMAAEGHNSTQIAARLFISPRTVETHRANFMRKLSLHSQTDLVRFAIRRSIISM
jgi:DNA-binding NarL/FixJ family response regulator